MIEQREKTGTRIYEDTMQNFQVTPYHNNQGREISQRTQALLDSLQDVMNRLQELSPVHMRGILEIAVRFPGPFSVAAMTSIAEKLVSSMAVHYLDILETFRQKAGQENIDEAEQTATITDCITDLFPTLAELSHKIAIQTLEDLVTLAAITVGLYGLSHAETAEQALHWLYVLPQAFAGQLAQEHLIATSPLQFTVMVHAVAAPTVMELPPMKVSFIAPTSPPIAHQPQFTTSSISEVFHGLDSAIADSQAAIAA